jgi:hypothetical protein
MPDPPLFDALRRGALETDGAHEALGGLDDVGRGAMLS